MDTILWVATIDSKDKNYGYNPFVGKTPPLSLHPFSNCGFSLTNTFISSQNTNCHVLDSGPVVWFHRFFRNFNPIFAGADLVLVKKAYKRYHSSPCPVYALTCAMLRATREYFTVGSIWNDLTFNWLVLSYFYLCRGGEMWWYSKPRTGPLTDIDF